MRKKSPNSRPAISRAEAETLCLLEAISLDGGTPTDITARLGLDPGLEDAVREAIQAIAGSGRVIVEYEPQDPAAPTLTMEEQAERDAWGLPFEMTELPEIRALRLSDLGIAALNAART